MNSKYGAESYWKATTPSTQFASVDQDRSFDTVIVGGGIAGLTAAYLLKKRGARVAVVEQYSIGSGETEKTTAHLTEILDTGYETIRSDFGTLEAALVAESSREAIRFIENQARINHDRLGIDCDFHRVPGFLYSENSKSLGGLKSELSAMKDIGINAEWSDVIPLPFKTVGGIQVSNQGRFHPGRYIQGIALEVNGNGSKVFEFAPMVRVEDGTPCTVWMEDGTRLTAENIVIATNAVTSSRFFLQTKVAAYRTYAAAVHLQTELPSDALYWDTADPYHYTRIQRGIAIVGGEDHKTGQKTETEENYAALENYIRQRYRIESLKAWSGQILNPVDGLPFIGLSPMTRHIYVATGFSGNGMTFGTISGILISDLISKGENPWQKLYAPNRIKPFASATEFIEENIDYPACLLKDRIRASDVPSISKIKPGEGKRIKLNGTVYAIYRDSQGLIHPLNAVCPHLGCLVHFNHAEKSWDCPCHGSRFNTDGEVLNGPSTTPLKGVSREAFGIKRESKPKRKAA